VGQSMDSRMDPKHMRLHLTAPRDEESELVRLAATRGPEGVMTVLRFKHDFAWFVLLGLRAIEVCLSPRPTGVAQVDLTDPVEFSQRMLEMEMIDEIFCLLRKFEKTPQIQARGLAILELLVMDDAEWRDEVARKGGVKIISRIADQGRDYPQMMAQVMTVMAYLAAEDYIEVMLGMHDGLEIISYCMYAYPSDSELMTRTSLALLNMTACESHAEEFLDKGAIPVLVKVMKEHQEDLNMGIIQCGVVTHLGVHPDACQVLVDEGWLEIVRDYMRLDTKNAVLQIACLKSLACFSTNPEWYLMLEELGVPELVGEAMINHSNDTGVQKYGHLFLGHYSTCSIL